MLPPSPIAIPAARHRRGNASGSAASAARRASDAPRSGARAPPGRRRLRLRRGRSRSPPTRGATAEWAVTVPSSHSARASAMKKSGTQIPSLRPLSTLRPCRIRDGIRSSVTTAWPSAASVQASMIDSTSASTRLTPGSTPTPTSVPAAIVSGRPIPSRRAGTANSPAQRGERDPRGVSEEDQRQRRLRQQLDGSPPILQIDQAEHRAGQQARGGEEDRRRDDRPLDPAGDGREREQHERDRREFPGSQLSPPLATVD